MGFFLVSLRTSGTRMLHRSAMARRATWEQVVPCRRAFSMYGVWGGGTTKTRQLTRKNRAPFGFS